MHGRPNIVLVHGAWADGSCWSEVIELLQKDGFSVRAPQFPMSSLSEDVGRLRQVLEFQDGPTIVVRTRPTSSVSSTSRRSGSTRASRSARSSRRGR